MDSPVGQPHSTDVVELGEDQRAADRAGLAVGDTVTVTERDSNDSKIAV